MKCSLCGAENPEGAASCHVCMTKFKQQAKAPAEVFKRTPEFHPRSQTMVHKKKTALPTWAGAILIIDALLSIGGLAISSAFVSEFYPEQSAAMGATALIFGSIAVFVLIGGVMAMLRKAWVLTLLACVASFFLTIAFGLFCGIVEALLSVAALAMLVQSRDEFTQLKD